MSEKMALRPYQCDAVKAILNEWREGRKHTLLVMATGLGKTIVLAHVTKDRLAAGRVLILAHRGELLEQAASKLKSAVDLDSVLEKAESSSIDSPIPITIGSAQSLAQDARLERFPADYFQTVIVDEAHHAMSDSYQKILNHFPNAMVLGVTATPDRGDKKELGQFFDSIAYEYNIAQGIKGGYLCPIKAQMIPLKLDLSGVKITTGDYSAGGIGSALDPFLEEIAMQMTAYCQNRKTVVFLPLIKTSQRFCDLLNNETNLRAAEVNGNSDDRAEVLADFESGKYDVLCNSMLLTEGWDCPTVDCIVILRPTKIRALFVQMVGRGTRPAPGKKDLLLLDFLWMTGKHDLCRPSALIASKPEMADRIDAMINSDEPIDIIEAEEQTERDAIKEREETLAKQLAEQRHKKKMLVDPLQYAISITDEALEDYEPTFAWEIAPPSEKQIEFLTKRGINPDSIECAGKAHAIIDRIVTRQQRGLTTPKQIRCLERFGFLHVGEWTFADASKMISRLSMNHWKVPQGIIPALYSPNNTEKGRSLEW